MMRVPPVVVVGDVMTDVLARAGDPLTPDRSTASQVQTRQGGAGAGVAHWLASLGCPVRFVGRVGADPFGMEAVEVLRRAGVDPAVTVDATLATGTVVVLVGADQAGADGTDVAPTMLPDAGANSALSALDLPPLDPASAPWLHVSGYTLLNPGSRRAGEAALAAAGGAIPRSVDVASAAALEALGPKEFLRITEGVEVVFCTLIEAEVLVGTRDPDTALARLTGSYREVVLKVGALGAHWASEGSATVTAPSCPPAGPVVDASGAGDAFAAAFIASALDGRPVRARLERGCAAAASAVTRREARPSSVSPGTPR